MSLGNQITATTTQVSGAVAIGSASSSKIATSIVESAPTMPASAVETASNVIVSAEVIGLCSFVVMLLSFMYNVYATNKRDKFNREVKERELRLREREYDGVNDRRKKKATSKAA